MIYRGVSVRITFEPAPGESEPAARARLHAALDSAVPGRRPSAVSDGGEAVLIARFRTRLGPHEAYQASLDAAKRAGLPARANIWVGSPGTSVFGDSPAMTQDILARIAAGQKTTCLSSFADYIVDGEHLPVEGNVITALDHTGLPALRYLVVQCCVLPFEDVATKFEGMTDPTRIKLWWDDHQVYFQRIGAFDPQMPIVCERFRVTEILSAALQSRKTACSTRS